MVNTIFGARVIHRVQNAAGLAARQAKAFAKAREHGLDITVHLAARPIVALVDHGRWIGVCDCGSGVALDRAWPDEARCFGCGALYRSVVWPADHAQVESALVKRPSLATRNWRPGEKVSDLRAENIEHGVESAEKV